MRIAVSSEFKKEIAPSEQSLFLILNEYRSRSVQYLVSLYAVSGKKIFMSSSTVPIPAIPKFSTRTFATFGERKAGRVGPK